MRKEKNTRITPRIRQRPRQLRKSSTPAEQKLWQHLRNRNLGNYKFRRQHPIGPFIADFFCAEVGLVIEVDGGGHLEQVAYDLARTTWLEDQGYHVIRFWNDDVLTKIDYVAQEILFVLNQLKEGKRDG